MAPAKKKPVGERRKKLTVFVPVDVLESALASSGENIAETVTTGLRMVAAAHAYTRLRALRGKVPTSIDIGVLRDDG